MQLLLSSLDWALAGAVLYVLLPPVPRRFVVVLSAFLAAQILGLAAHVPGGVGVFEGVIVLLLKPYMTSVQLAPALVVYRVIYYLAPLSIALIVLAGAEISERRHRATPRGDDARCHRRAWRERLTPRILATLTFVAGVVLLFSGATPAAAHRLALLDRFVPLGVIETSHILGSVAGALLLLLSQGLSRRLDAAYYLDHGGDRGRHRRVALQGRGLRGSDRARSAPGRAAARAADVRSQGRAVCDALLAGVDGGGRRRAGRVGVARALRVPARRVLAPICGGSSRWTARRRDSCAARWPRRPSSCSSAVARLIGHAPHEVDPPSDRDLADAGRDHRRTSRRRIRNLIYLRDKALLFDEARDGFVMYAREAAHVGRARRSGRTARSRIGELIRLFIERCDDFGGTPVFYEVGKQHLHHYADFGLAFVKLGEEARVDLTQFSLDGRQGARFRQVIRRLAKDGGTFRVIPADEVPRGDEQPARRVRRLARAEDRRRERVLGRLLRSGVSRAVPAWRSSSAAIASSPSPTSGRVRAGTSCRSI